MPLYDLKCTSCENTDTNVYVPLFDAERPACTKCASPTTVVPSRVGAFIFHGKGTYDRGFTSKTAPE